jgi:hypothetical protein
MDNVRPYYHHVILDYLERHYWEIFEHTSYSPDMNPRDFDVFDRIKRRLKGISFPSLAMLIASYDKRIRDLKEAHSFLGI